MGENTLAIHGLNVSANNPDFLLVPTLSSLLPPKSTTLALDQTKTITARSYEPTFDTDLVVDDEVWGGLSSQQFVVDGFQPPGLRISEIHYPPADRSLEELTADFAHESNFEFIELVNTSDQTTDLANAQFIRANGKRVEFDFSKGTITTLGPNERLLVVVNTDAFVARYGGNLPVAGPWKGALSSNGELLTLTVGVAKIHEFAYRDEWHAATDGHGFSLEIIDSAAPNLASWASDQPGGSPGRENVPRVSGNANHDGQFDDADLNKVLTAGEYEDDPPNNSTFAEGTGTGMAILTRRISYLHSR